MTFNLNLVLDKHQLKEIMSALDNLNSNVSAQAQATQALAAAVLTILPEINPVPGSGATEAQVQAAADAVAAITASITAQTAALVAAATPAGPQPPLANTPTGIVATTGPSGSVTLTWPFAPGAQAYNVKRSGTQGGPYSTIGTAPSNFKNPVTFTETLPAGVEVFYVISATNDAGESADSAEVSVTPVA